MPKKVSPAIQLAGNNPMDIAFALIGEGTKRLDAGLSMVAADLGELFRDPVRSAEAQKFVRAGQAFIDAGRAMMKAMSEES